MAAAPKRGLETAVITLDLMVEDPAWREAWPDAAMIAEQTLRAAADRVLTPDLSVELALVLMNDAGVRALNRDYRRQDKPTNVLSFPALDAAAAVAARSGVLPAGWPQAAPLALGDIVLAYETVAGEAAAQGKSFSDHTRHLLVHGFLHLLGYDHEGDAAAMEMEGLEIAILGALNVANPYAADCGA